MPHAISTPVPHPINCHKVIIVASERDIVLNNSNMKEALWSGFSGGSPNKKKTRTQKQKNMKKKKEKTNKNGVGVGEGVNPQNTHNKNEIKKE